MANVKQIKQKTTGTLLDIEDTQARTDIASEVVNRTNADKALDEKKVELPKDNGGNILNGTSGQILQSNGDGTTRWVNKPTTGTGGIAEETDPTVPEWAKQPTKPTYTAHEVEHCRIQRKFRLKRQICRMTVDF